MRLHDRNVRLIAVLGGLLLWMAASEDSLAGGRRRRSEEPSPPPQDQPSAPPSDLPSNAPPPPPPPSCPEGFTAMSDFDAKRLLEEVGRAATFNNALAVVSATGTACLLPIVQPDGTWNIQPAAVAASEGEISLPQPPTPIEGEAPGPPLRGTGVVLLGTQVLFFPVVTSAMGSVWGNGIGGLLAGYAVDTGRTSLPQTAEEAAALFDSVFGSDSRGPNKPAFVKGGARRKSKSQYYVAVERVSQTVRPGEPIILSPSLTIVDGEGGLVRLFSIALVTEGGQNRVVAIHTTGVGGWGAYIYSLWSLY